MHQESQVSRGKHRFNTTFLVLLLFAAMAAGGIWLLTRATAAVNVNVIYVTVDGGTSTKDGKSWATAYSSADLQTAIGQSAASKDEAVEVWVASGDYKRTAELTLKKGAKLYGGFAGDETTAASRDARDIANNKTTLDGQKGNFSIVTGGKDAASNDTRIDGFTITGGCKNNNGGGMYNSGSSPTVTNCTFSGNSAGSSNSSSSGGGMYNENSSPTVTNCTFSGNSANNNGGGGMFNKNSSPTVTNCTFSGNSAKNGGGMCNYSSSSSPTVTNCTFSGNSAGSNGGGMYNNGSSPTVTNCTFSGNSATSYGGSMYNQDSSPTVTNCTFSGNSATGSSSSGGGMCNKNGSSPTVTNCTFSGNSAAGFGGGMYNENSSSPSPTVTNCTFSGNSADSLGGGMYNKGSNPTVTNCTFSGNSAKNRGGGMYNSDTSSPTVTNCTFSGNSAAYGGGMYNYSGNPTVTNSIFWDNSATTGTEIYNDTGASPKFSYCVIKENRPSGGSYTGIISSDPMLRAVTSTDKYISSADAKSARSRDVYMYVISADTAEAAKNSSALGEGLAVGITIDGTSVDIPSADQRGRARRPYYVDLGAYQYISSGDTPVYSITLSDVTMEIGTSKDLNAATKPVNFASLSYDNVSGDAAAITSADGKVTATAKERGRTTVTIKSVYTQKSGSNDGTSADVMITVNAKSPATPATPSENTSLATDSDKSGVIVIEPNTYEDFAIYDGFVNLSDDGTLPGGITVSSLDAIIASSVDISTDSAIYTSADVRGAIARYWNLETASPDKVRIVEVANTVASLDDGEGDTLFAKFWRFLKSLLGANDNDNSYLPLQTNFTIRSADIAALPDYVKTGLTADNLLTSVDLFVIVKSGGTAEARSLHDITAVSNDEKAFITVSGDNSSGYTISTRVMLFNMEGGVSGDKTNGAKWVQKFYAMTADSKTTPRSADNYFIVQDGKADDAYNLCMAFAAKEVNSAALSVTISGDIPAASVDWTLSGDAATISGAGTSSDIAVDSGTWTISAGEVPGYTLTLTPASKDIAWGSEQTFVITYSQIHVESVSLDKTLELYVGSNDVTLTASVSPDNALVRTVKWESSSADVATVDTGGKIHAVKAGTAVITATTVDGGKSDDCTVTVKQYASKLTISGIGDQTYTGSAIEPEVTVSDDTTPLTASKDYTVAYGDNTDVGTATVTITGIGNYTGTKQTTFKIAPKPTSIDVTEGTKTDGSGSGVLNIETGSVEDFAIYDALKDLAEAGGLPAGISSDAAAIPATSADLQVSRDIYSKDVIVGAINEYWDITDTTAEKTSLVTVRNTIGETSYADEDGGLFAKFWRMLVSVFTGEKPASGDYLPLQTNFTIASADIAKLPDSVKNGLTADNLTQRINLFAIVQSGDKVYARSLTDAASDDAASYITVTGTSADQFCVKTRVMVFDMPGGVSGDKTTGAAWVKPLGITSGDSKRGDNYFIVQDGKADGAYNLCMAFAAKETNYAKLSVTISGDIPAADVAWQMTANGETKVISGDYTDDAAKGGAYTFTFPDKHGYSLVITKNGEAAGSNIDITWGTACAVTAEYKEIEIQSITLDQSSAVIKQGESFLIRATAEPSGTIHSTLTWTSSSSEIAAVTEKGVVTGVTAGEVTITATAASGVSASCTVTVSEEKEPEKENTAAPAKPPVKPDSAPEYITAPNGPVTITTIPDNATDAEKEAALEEAADRITGIDKEDLEITDGVITVNRALAMKLANEKYGATLATDAFVAIPVFTASIASADDYGKVVMSAFEVKGSQLFTDTPSEIQMLKVMTGVSADFFEYVSKPEDFADECFTVLDMNDAVVTGKLDADTTYKLVMFIKDGGRFDLDGGKADGKVTDPAAIIKKETTTPDNGGSNGGSGCNAGAFGFGMALLALCLPMLIKRRKR